MIRAFKNLSVVMQTRYIILENLLGIIPVYKMVDTCAGEFEAVSPYYYSTYDETTESFPSDKKKSYRYRFGSYQNRSRYRI